jgi:hypothetical protein
MDVCTAILPADDLPGGAMARRDDASDRMKVTLKLNTALYRRLQHHAIDTDKTASELVEMAIEALLSRKTAKS